MKEEKSAHFLDTIGEFSIQEKQLIMDHTHNLHLEKGEFLLKYGETCKDISFVKKGIVRFYLLTEEGEELTMMFLSPYEMVLRIESFLKNVPSNGFLECITACDFVCISKENWLQIKKKVKNFGATIAEHGSLFMSKKLEFQRRLLNNDALSAYHEFMKRNKAIADQIPMKHLASYLGITPSSLSRIKKELTVK
jgi:CRP-like cAMP-binding protein